MTNANVKIHCLANGSYAYDWLILITVSQHPDRETTHKSLCKGALKIGLLKTKVGFYGDHSCFLAPRKRGTRHNGNYSSVNCTSENINIGKCKLFDTYMQ